MSDQLFHRVEQAFLADWLDQERAEAARGIQLDEWLDVEAEGYICPRSGTMGGDESGFNAISNAVARLCLNGVQEALPAWSSTSSIGTITVVREHDPVIERRLKLFPRGLLEINWATGAPGIFWPEAWFMTALPEFNRCIVTASVDSTDTWGWTDFALGHFAPAENLLDSSLQILTQYWCTHHGYRQEPFESVIRPGLVSANDAWQAAQTVWFQELPS